MLPAPATGVKPCVTMAANARLHGEKLTWVSSRASKGLWYALLNQSVTEMEEDHIIALANRSSSKRRRS